MKYAIVEGNASNGYHIAELTGKYLRRSAPPEPPTASENSASSGGNRQRHGHKDLHRHQKENLPRCRARRGVGHSNHHQHTGIRPRSVGTPGQQRKLVQALICPRPPSPSSKTPHPTATMSRNSPAKNSAAPLHSPPPTAAPPSPNNAPMSSNADNPAPPAFGGRASSSSPASDPVQPLMPPMLNSQPAGRRASHEQHGAARKRQR